MRRTQEDGDLHSYACRAAEALNVALVLDQCIYMLLQSETDQASRDQITMVRILALKNKEKFITQVAELYASAYSLDELKALVAFLESPAGEAMRKKQPGVEGRIRETTMAFLNSLADELN
jgi:hypothetical protein